MIPEMWTTRALLQPHVFVDLPMSHYGHQSKGVEGHLGAVGNGLMQLGDLWAEFVEGSVSPFGLESVD